MRRVVVENDADSGLRWVVVVDHRQELDELATAMTLGDESMYVSGREINAGEKRQSPESDVLEFARVSLVQRRNRGEIWTCRADGLDAGLLIVGENHHAGLACAASKHLDLFVHAENLHHLGVEVWVPALKVVAHFVGTKVMSCEDLRHRPPGEPSERWVAGFLAVCANVLSQRRRRPQLDGISEIFRFLAGKRNHPCNRLRGLFRLAPPPCKIVQRRDCSDLERL